ncbi:MAG: hypothetical protein ABIP39_12310 [Polyangiaceae bacterium]
MSRATFHELRGATLDRVDVDWRNGITLISFLPPPGVRGSFALRVTEFSKIDITRKAEASRVVREVHRVQGESGAKVSVEISMESGEKHHIEAQEIALDPPTG